MGIFYSLLSFWIFHLVFKRLMQNFVYICTKIQKMQFSLCILHLYFAKENSWILNCFNRESSAVRVRTAEESSLERARTAEDIPQQCVRLFGWEVAVEGSPRNVHVPQRILCSMCTFRWGILCGTYTYRGEFSIKAI